MWSHKQWYWNLIGAIVVPEENDLEAKLSIDAVTNFFCGNKRANDITKGWHKWSLKNLKVGDFLLIKFRDGMVMPKKISFKIAHYKAITSLAKIQKWETLGGKNWLERRKAVSKIKFDI